MPYYITCQPTPRLRTEGGIGVALAYRATAKKAPVDCLHHNVNENVQASRNNMIENKVCQENIM